MKVLVTGSTGQLGSEFKKISKKYKYDWVFKDSVQFNFFNTGKINSLLDNINPEIIINCAAYTSVENAELDYESAKIINYKAIHLISKWSSINSCKLIHISTDYVFDGKHTSPIGENEKPNPINNYGKSKLKGDLACLKYNPDSVIIRTSLLYSSYNNNFVKKIISKLKAKNMINVAIDQFSSPTYSADLCQVILKIIQSKNWIPGIYNFTNHGNMSIYDFAIEINKIFGGKILIRPIFLDNFSQLVKRPKYSVLDNSKIIKMYGVMIKDYKISLKKCIELIKNEK